MPSNYYIYVYLDPRKPGKYFYSSLNISFLYEPFYVGLGKNERKFRHLTKYSLRPKTAKNSKIRKITSDNYNIKDYIIELHSNINNSNAILYEIFYIKNIGRLDLKTGPLTNLTDGGEGAVALSKETRAKMSLSKLGKKQSEEQVIDRAKKNTGQKRDNATKLKMSLAQQGKTHSNETKSKLSEIKKGVKTITTYPEYLITSPIGEEFCIRGNIGQFCKDNNLSYKTIMANRDKGKILSLTKHHGKFPASLNCLGWEIRKIKERGVA